MKSHAQHDRKRAGKVARRKTRNVRKESRGAEHAANKRTKKETEKLRKDPTGLSRFF